MPNLVGLEGIRQKEIECKIVSSISAALKSVRAGVPATMAGDDGAINVWKRDNGQFQVCFCRRLCELDTKVYSHWSDVSKWLKKWMPKMNEFHS